MSSPAPGKRRSDSDVLKLIEANYEVNLNNGLNKFVVKFHGPPNTLYEHGVWKIRVELSERYPFEPPVISFLNKIYHPNIDEISGNVCLDVLNQKWSAMFDLTNIFESFLPQLLTYPNSKDPLNSEAGTLYEENKHGYKSRVREYINRYATESALVTVDDNKRFRSNPEESPSSPRRPRAPRTPPETEEDHYSSESSMSEDDGDNKSNHEDEDDDEDDHGNGNGDVNFNVKKISSTASATVTSANEDANETTNATSDPNVSIPATSTTVINDDDESTLDDDEYSQPPPEDEAKE